MASSFAVTPYSYALRELEASFVAHREGEHGYTLVENSCIATGLRFRCPRCFRRTGSLQLSHWVLCWFAGRGVPDDGADRWIIYLGVTLDTVTFIGPGSGGVRCGHHFHAFVRAGRVIVDLEGPE